MQKAYLPTYCSEVLRGPAAYGYQFLLGPHHLEWGKAVNEHHRILALAARDHGKSHFFCFGYVLWQIHVRNPGRLGYIFSASDQQAQEHLDKIRKELLGGGEHGDDNPMLKELLPLKKDSARTMVFANGSEVRARGFGSRVRGGHPFWAIGDDMLNDDHIWSEAVRGKAVDYYLSAIEPMVVPGGQIVIVGTPFHALDLYKHLKDAGEYHIMRHPAIHPATGKPLWPGRYDQARLDQRKRILASSIRWSREYLCQPITDEASLFPSWMFDQAGVKRNYALGLPGSYWEEQGFTTFMGVDLALSASSGADYFVAFVIAIDPVDGSRWVVGIHRAKGMGYQEQVDTIVNLANHYSCALAFVEANQYQRVISDMVIRESDAPIKAFYTTGRGGSKQATTQRRGIKGTYSGNKNALDQGIPSLRMLLENGKLKIPWDRATRSVVETWLGEMQSFGWAEGKMQGIGAHDDTVMALWMADQAAGIGGAFSGFDAGENEEGEQRSGPIFDVFGADGQSDTGQPGQGDIPDFFGLGALDANPGEQLDKDALWGDSVF
tara:strand:+ start:911 stop:2557 length:1647 start_codon:yes stop_codon:yes gene_type:complete